MKRFAMEIRPVGAECVYRSGSLRLSVLSDRILRVERSADGEFEDRPSQMVVCRNFANPTFEATETANKITIKTKCALFEVNKKTLGCSVVVDGVPTKPRARYNLGGTARTLDGTNGFCFRRYGRTDAGGGFGIAIIGGGIMAKNGVTVADDSKTYLISPDGTPAPRKKGSVDKYVFAFGKDYAGGLKEYYCLTGYTPILPKYALGNWWSRYFVYTEQSYLELMDKFAAKRVPISVATIDMDWHIVDNVPKDIKGKNPTQGAGWTGYTFEKSLFPDHKRFFRELKKRNLAITMNLHPRDGVRYYEEQYPAMAAANGIDPSTKRPVAFDLTNPVFAESYFDILHHPYEDDGVDFWWIDWQQGKKSALPGLDPLWLLNHYHFLDAGRNGRTPLILSRYAGLGSHRYPIGFSGDTIVSWASLKLQPKFTATAANVGYTWWSHDIGGHMFGKGNGELYLRWIQMGVFLPINRLHSTKRDDFSKEPWLYGPEIEEIAEEWLRLRHRLLPYLYTANVLTAAEGVPLVSPMYYADTSKEAYRAENQYLFGSELVVAPVLRRVASDGTAPVEVWLPKGKWTDVFTGERRDGGRKFVTRRDLGSIPVYARDGAIVPMLAKCEDNSLVFDDLEVLAFVGNGKYRMYDEASHVDFEMRVEGDKVTLAIDPSEGCPTRTVRVCFRGREVGRIECDAALEAAPGSVTVPAVRTRITAYIAK